MAQDTQVKKAEIFTRKRCYSHEINETLPVNFGVGVEWKMRDGSKLITILKKKPRTVYGEVSNFKGWSFGAVHYYGYLKFSQLDSKFIKVSDDEKKYGYKDGDISGIWCGEYPIIADAHTIEVTHTATEDIYRISMFDDKGNKKPDYEKGEPTPLFNSRKEVIDAVRSEFQRIFGEGWTLNEEDLE